MGEPKKGDEVKFTSENKDFNLPNGEFLVTDGPLKDQVLIITDGKVSDIQNPEMKDEEVKQMSAVQVEKFSTIKQLSILNKKLQMELDSTPAAPATTAVPENDYEYKNNGFSSQHLSSEIQSITKFQPKKK